MIESLLGSLFNSVQPYLPYTAATTLAGTELGRAAFGPANGASTPLPFATAAALLTGVAIALAGVAARTTVQKDIT